ncbi:tyrosine-type recombinase/integrase [Sporosarcina sp. ACRSL]|uniref:tyrosine-type recombinase/integrase n=1 Tax=Sporosarcina sp. ACRSL TaxID=2918215 RepID=UPI001EF73E68|nr:tyrosine-type recombinase/integrase [Sporosarcina sp. ACRSL]MCG7342676.1 tyrosine-type recombinase/integrase [Sporosarcina sp. ACRSL]
MIFGKTNNYFSILAIEEILKTIDFTNAIERKHFIILSLLYETGARVNEILNAKVEDIQLHNQPNIKLQCLHTTRIVPFSYSLSKVIEQYIAEYNLVAHQKIFFHNMNISCTELCRQLRIYIRRARMMNPYIIPDYDSVYGYRISRANHLYQAGYSIEELHHFLGHNDINQTKKIIGILYHDTRTH